MPEQEVVKSEKTITIPTEGYVAARAASGAISRHNGDAVAVATAGATIDEVYSLAAEALDVKVSVLQEKYGHLNLGQQRMNLGNRLRGVVNKINRNNEAEAKKENGSVGVSGEVYIETISASVRDAVEAREAVGAKAKVEAEKAKAEAAAQKAAEKEAKAKARDEAKALKVKAEMEKAAAEETTKTTAKGK